MISSYVPKTFTHETTTLDTNDKEPIRILTYFVAYSISPLRSMAISNSWSGLLPVSSNVIFGRFLNLQHKHKF